MSTPTKPPRKIWNPAWKSMTGTTATARKPSISRRYCMMTSPSFGCPDYQISTTARLDLLGTPDGWLKMQKAPTDPLGPVGAIHADRRITLAQSLNPIDCPFPAPRLLWVDFLVPGPCGGNAISGRF